METSRNMCMPNSLMSVVYENFGCSSSFFCCLLSAHVTCSSCRGSPSTWSYALLCVIAHWAWWKSSIKDPWYSVFRVDDWVILYLLFSLCRFELVCNALDKLPTSSHLEFPFAAVSPTDEFFIFPFLAISSFLFWFSSLLILFLLFVSFLKFSVCSFSFALLESSPRLCACWTSAWPLNCLPVL